jgi:hypothetical protein
MLQGINRPPNKGQKIRRPLVGLSNRLHSGSCCTFQEPARLVVRRLQLGQAPSKLCNGMRSRTAAQALNRDPVYLFAHETLRVVAEEAFGHSVEQYLARIHAWADGYRSRGWPESTPQYLLRPFGRLLAARGDLERLVQLATDTKQHDRLRELGSADETAIQQIVAAQQLLLTDTGPNLTTAVVLALQRDRLTRRYDFLPDAVPACGRSPWCRGELPGPGRMLRQLSGIASDG